MISRSRIAITNLQRTGYGGAAALPVDAYDDPLTVHVVGMASPAQLGWPMAIRRDGGGAWPGTGMLILSMPWS